MKCLTITLPSKGELETPTLEFMKSCGFVINRTNPKQYEAEVIGNSQLKIRFQRAWDIPVKVNEGNADLGITGLDIQKEHQTEDSQVIVVCEDLNYGNCQLVLAVPEDWVDVTSVSDLADLALLWHEKGKDLRIATKFPNLTRNFLYEKGIHYFSLVVSYGAIESAPRMGYADIISDLTTTGITLRENRLKTIKNATILSSQACLIGNKKILKQDKEKLELTKRVIEAFESRCGAKEYSLIVATIKTENPEKIFQAISEDIKLLGLERPTIFKVYSQETEKDCYTINIIIKNEHLFGIVEDLRKKEVSGILVFPAEYIFVSKSLWYEELLGKLNLRKN
jgi:ATP phosphoribosyltransferase